MLIGVNKFLSMHCILTDSASIIYIKKIYLKYLLSKTKTQFIWNLTFFLRLGKNLVRVDLLTRREQVKPACPLIVISQSYSLPAKGGRLCATLVCDLNEISEQAGAPHILDHISFPHLHAQSLNSSPAFHAGPAAGQFYYLRLFLSMDAQVRSTSCL